MAKSPFLRGFVTSPWFSRRAGSNAGGSRPRHNNEGLLVDEAGQAILDGTNAPIELERTTSTFPEAATLYDEQFPVNTPELTMLNGITYSGMTWAATSTVGQCNFVMDQAADGAPTINLPIQFVLTGSAKPYTKLSFSWRVRDTILGSNVPSASRPTPHALVQLRQGETLETENQPAGVAVGDGFVRNTWTAQDGDPYGNITSLSIKFGEDVYFDLDHEIQIQDITLTQGL